MKTYRPIFLQHLGIRLKGMTVHRLRLHRHLPEVEQVKPHCHSFSQMLLYLGGAGEQRIGIHRWSIHTGVVCFVPSHFTHEFHETVGRRPLCLVLEFDVRGARRHGPRRAQLTQSDLAQIRRCLSNLSPWAHYPQAAVQLRVPALVLEILDLLLNAIGWYPTGWHDRGVSPLVTAVEKAWSRLGDSHVTPAQLAKTLDYQPDYLNRSFKLACGLTLGQFCSQKRIEKIKRWLKEDISIGELAEKAGFHDQNYFARWFRRQTGMTPSAWRKQA